MIVLKPHRALQFVYRASVLATIAVSLSVGTAYAGVLSREEAIALALERDLEIAQSHDREAMLRDTARVSAALPAPTLTLSAANVPVDTFAIDQEPMTQLQVKLSQMLPPGDSRHWRATSQERDAQVMVVQRALRRAMLQHQLRTAWADGWVAQASMKSLETNRVLFEQTLATTRASYSAGMRQARQREVLGAQAALARLDERIERYAMLFDTTREQFGEWLSEGEVKRLHFANDTDPKPTESGITFSAARHPAVELAQAQRQVAEAEQRLASELGKGSRGISLSYGYREDPANGGDRADFVTLGFSMDLASLRGGANTSRRNAATARLNAADKEAELQRARLLRDYRQLQAKLTRLQSRRSVYRDELLPQYRQQADVTRRAFASDEARFIDVQLVLIDLLNAELDALAIDAELMKTEATFDYLMTTTASAGERQ